MSLITISGMSLLIVVDNDPSSGAGYSFPIGWTAINNTNGDTYKKIGSSATNWKKLAYALL